LKSLEKFSSFCTKVNYFKKLESSQLSAMCPKISVPALYGVLTVFRLVVCT